MSSRSRSTNADVTTGYTVYTNGSPQNYTNVSTIDRETMTGVDIGEYYAKKRRGELLPMNEFTHCKIKGSSSSSPASATGGSSPQYVITGLRAINWANWTVTEAELANIADQYRDDAEHFVNIAAAKIYGRGHDTLTMLAELHKVARMFRNAVGTLSNLLKGRDIAQAWLEYRYGWRLLYFDIVDIQKALSQIDGEMKRFKERVGYSIDSQLTRTSVPYDWATQHGSYDVVDEYDVSVRGAVVADINPPEFRFNPLTTSWELVRFSFIVDWFLDIGSWLEALSFLTIASDYVAAGGVKVTFRRKIENHQCVPDSPYLSVTGDWTSDVSGEYVVRTPASVGKFPQPLINLDAFKVMDLLALIFGGKAPRT